MVVIIGKFGPGQKYFYNIEILEKTIKTQKKPQKTKKKTRKTQKKPRKNLEKLTKNLEKHIKNFRKQYLNNRFEKRFDPSNPKRLFGAVYGSNYW